MFLNLSCQRDHPGYLTNEERSRLYASHNAIAADYKELLSKYDSSSSVLSDTLKFLYVGMKRMHHQAESNYKLLMRRNEGRYKKANKMMKKRMRMGMQMQKSMTSEWFFQMMAMHQKLVQLHQKVGQEAMVKINHRLAKKYGQMKNIISKSDKSFERPYNKKGDPSRLNGERLFREKCGSCHGRKGRGIAHVFPPVVDTKWVTNDKSIPLRIVLNGLQDSIKVGQTIYSGVMPAYRARLSAAEIGAIINYLRKESEGNYGTISQRDVINISAAYSDRSKPLTAKELKFK